ncbi:parB-like partition protein [Oscillibacter sp. CAG:241]|nr:parB-like partition protein [Oscillibacter sp. CAG:241]
MAKSNASGLLTSLDSLFTTQEQRDAAKRDVVLDLTLDQIGDFPNHPFKVRQDEAMMEMMESVQLHGVLVPGLVRQLADGSYQMVSGHRRKLASRLAGLDTLPCIVRDLTDDEAIIVMVDSNLQREKVLPSEKAFAYRMKLEAMRRQGKRTDLTSTPVVEKLKGKDALSSAIIGKAAGDSYEQVRRYIRLTYLLPEILAMVDDSKIAFRPAVELSYLAEKEQRILYDAMGHADCTPSLAQAIKMKSFSREGKLSEAVIRSIMAEEKPNQKEQFRIPKERISKYFKPGTPARTMEDTIIKALDYYRKRQREIER